MSIKLLILTMAIIATGCMAGKKAICTMKQGVEAGKGITGEITIEQGSESAETKFKIDIKGVNVTDENSLSKGFHVHENGNLSNECLAAGGHFNPLNKDHGGPTNSVRHVGDLGNVVVKLDGTIKIDITDKIANLYGQNSIIGKAIVLHEKKDDLTTQPTGDAGKRLACCLIKEDSTGNAFQITPSIFLSLILTISMYMFL